MCEFVFIARARIGPIVCRVSFFYLRRNGENAQTMAIEFH